VPMREQIEEEIRSFLLRDVLRPGDASGLSSEVSLLSGVLDSFGLVQLLEFLEERYDVTVDGDDVVDENFTSLASVAAFIEAKRRGAG
jgi:acyl carrier protein